MYLVIQAFLSHILTKCCQQYTDVSFCLDASACPVVIFTVCSIFKCIHRNIYMILLCLQALHNVFRTTEENPDHILNVLRTTIEEKCIPYKQSEYVITLTAHIFACFSQYLCCSLACVILCIESCHFPLY